MELDRRAFLGGVFVVAGCAGSGSGETPAATGSETATATATATQSPTPTASPTPTPLPALRGADSGELPGELVENAYPQVFYEVLFAEFDTVDGSRLFKVGVWAENSGTSTIGTLQGILRFYAGDELVATKQDYLYSLEYQERKRIDGRVRDRLDDLTRWTLAVKKG